jgi:hypothetical protein
MSGQEKPGEHLSNAITLLGALEHQLRALPPAQYRDAAELAEAISRRLWKALYQLEPQRRRLAGVDR